MELLNGTKNEILLPFVMDAILSADLANNLFNSK